MISSIGGQSNAYTTDDETVFWETVPSQYLPLVLWLEADRMATLRIDKDTFTNERDVVKEERRMRVDNQPFGRLNEIIYDQAFTAHPYKHATIGSMADLEAASVDDVRDFYRTYYVPSNATLVLVGDFDSTQATAAGGAVSRARAEGRARGAARHSQGTAADPGEARHAAASRGRCRPSSWRITSPTTGNPDSYPLHIAAKVLSDGQTLAHLPEAGVRQADGGRRVRQREPDRGSESVLRGRDRAAGAHARRGGEGADRGGRAAESGADHAITSCSGRRTSSRATTS